MRAIVFSVWSALPSKAFGTIGWFTSVVIGLWPEQVKEWTYWLITPAQLRLWALMAVVIFTLYWIIFWIIRPRSSSELTLSCSDKKENHVSGNSFCGPTIIGEYGVINYHTNHSRTFADPHAQSWPGISIHFLCRVHEQPVDRRKVLIQLGDTQDQSAVLYLTARNLLLFTINDRFGDVYSVECRSGEAGVPFNKFIIISAELAVMATQSLLRISLNGQPLGERTVPAQIQFTNREWVKNAVIAGNSNGVDNAKCDVGELVAIDRHLTSNERIQLFQHWREKWQLT